jgi:ABC-type multidrug transport system permease subunit
VGRRTGAAVVVAVVVVRHNILMHPSPTPQAATTILGILAGVFVPAPQVPPGWVWLHEANPFSHLLKAVLAVTFYCDPTEVAGGGPCPTMPLVSPLGAVRVGQYAFLSGRYGFAYEARWTRYGIAIGITAAICAACALALRLLRVPWTHLALIRAGRSKAVGGAA